MTESKTLFLEDLTAKVREYREAGKVVVQSHGIFDLIHPGIIAHLDAARGQGDVLVVTVIRDEHVRRGPGRPIFNDKLRAKNVAALSQVDHVCIVADEIPYESVKRIKPDVLAYGQTYKERDRRIHEKLFEEERELYFGKSRIFETGGIPFSSSEIINDIFEMYPDETREFIRKFRERYGFEEIRDRLKGLRDLTVLLIGDGIVDEYHYCKEMNKSAKSPIVVNRYLEHEVFAGGAFAVANHVAGLCAEVRLVSLLGAEDSREDFLRRSLKPNVHPTFFVRDDGPTVIKKRYINQYLNQKLFEVNYLNDSMIGGELEEEILRHIESAVSGCDLVLVSDFGHGLITAPVIRALEKHSPLLAVTSQSNGANAGFNLITKYRKADFVCLDETEARLAAQDRYADIERVIDTITGRIETGGLIITQGKKGSVGIDGDKVMNRTPIFSTKVIDTIGAGDAFFSYAALCAAAGMPLDLVSFIGNAVGALAVRIVGNKRSVERGELLEFIHSLLK